MPDAKKPWRVRTLDGVLRSEHTEEEVASRQTELANEQATQFGIAARYTFGKEEGGE